VESLQSHMILTMSHWSSGLTCLLPATRVTGPNPLGDLCETGILLLALSRYKSLFGIECNTPTTTTYCLVDLSSNVCTTSSNNKSNFYQLFPCSKVSLTSYTDLFIALRDRVNKNDLYQLLIFNNMRLIKLLPTCILHLRNRVNIKKRH
jgi:hypothetical protein